MRNRRSGFASFALLLALFVVLVIGLVWALVLGDRASRRLSLEYEVYRDSTSLIEAYRNGEDPRSGRDLLGLGLYDSYGQALVREGSAPANLRLAELASSSLEVERRSSSVRVRRLIGSQMMGGMMGLGQGRRRMGQGLSGDLPPGWPLPPQGAQPASPPPAPGASRGSAGANPGAAPGFPPGAAPGAFPGAAAGYGAAAYGGARAVFLEYPLPHGLASEGGAFAIAALVSLALASLYALILAVFRRNAELGERERRNRELVQLGEAARTLAHEIKNPLAIVRVQTASLRRAASQLTGGGASQSAVGAASQSAGGAASQASSGASSSANARLEDRVLAGADIIDEELRRLSGLSDRIRDFLKGGDGEPRRVELAPFLKAYAARYADAAPPLGLGAPPAGAAVHADPERLSLALDNLVRNAYEATAQAGATASPAAASPAAASPAEAVSATLQAPEILVEQRGRFWEMAVADRGPGVPVELRERVFELFFTSKDGGSGIGLALARRIAESAGGSLSCRPREGGGSLFVLALPAER